MKVSSEERSKQNKRLQNAGQVRRLSTQVAFQDQDQSKSIGFQNQNNHQNNRSRNQNKNSFRFTGTFQPVSQITSARIPLNTQEYQGQNQEFDNTQLQTERLKPKYNDLEQNLQQIDQKSSFQSRQQSFPQRKASNSIQISPFKKRIISNDQDKLKIQLPLEIDKEFTDSFEKSQDSMKSEAQQSFVKDQVHECRMIRRKITNHRRQVSRKVSHLIKRANFPYDEQSRFSAINNALMCQEYNQALVPNFYNQSSRPEHLRKLYPDKKENQDLSWMHQKDKNFQSHLKSDTYRSNSNESSTLNENCVSPKGFDNKNNSGDSKLNSPVFFSQKARQVVGSPQSLIKNRLSNTAISKTSQFSKQQPKSPTKLVPHSSKKLVPPRKRESSTTQLGNQEQKRGQQIFSPQHRYPIMKSSLTVNQIMQPPGSRNSSSQFNFPTNTSEKVTNDTKEYRQRLHSQSSLHLIQENTDSRVNLHTGLEDYKHFEIPYEEDDEYYEVPVNTEKVRTDLEHLDDAQDDLTSCQSVSECEEDSSQQSQQQLQIEQQVNQTESSTTEYDENERICKPRERNQQLRDIISHKIKDIIVFPDRMAESNEVVLPLNFLLPKIKKKKPKIISEALKVRPSIEKVQAKNPLDFHAMINDYQIAGLNTEVLISPSSQINKLELTKEQNKLLHAQMSNYESQFGEWNPKRRLEDCDRTDEQKQDKKTKKKDSIAIPWFQAGGRVSQKWAEEKITLRDQIRNQIYSDVEQKALDRKELQINLTTAVLADGKHQDETDAIIDQIWADENQANLKVKRSTKLAKEFVMKKSFGPRISYTNQLYNQKKDNLNLILKPTTEKVLSTSRSQQAKRLLRKQNGQKETRLNRMSTIERMLDVISKADVRPSQ